MSDMTIFVEVWDKEIRECADGLDLTDSEDRASFRMLVERRFRLCKFSAMRELAEAKGLPTATSRWGQARILAEAFIKTVA